MKINYLYNFEEIEEFTVEELIFKLSQNSGIQLNEIKLKDFIFFNDKVIQSGRGVYILKNQNEFFYVGDCTSRSFIERIPSHFDTKTEAWMNIAVKHYAKSKFNLDKSEVNNEHLSKAASMILDEYSIILINFLNHSESKISNFEKLLMNVLNPVNKPKKVRHFELNQKVSDAIMFN